jgi:uncharacterized protein YdaU (DUF1376 family)
MTMPSLDYLSEYAGDFFKETVGLTLEEKGLRATLRFISCDQNPVGTLPADDVELACLANITTKKLAALKPRALKGFVRQGERLVNESLQQQYAGMLERKAKRSRAGKAGNAARWHRDENPSDCDPIAIAIFFFIFFFK